MIILLQNLSLVNQRMKLLLIASAFGLFEAHKGRRRGEGHDDDDDGEDEQQEGQ